MRLSYTKNHENGSAEAISSNDYYPFGLNHINIGGKTGVPPVYSSAVTFENWKYNGKELEETGMYDYGARFYMPDIGRFGMYDPLAEKTFEPYSYVYNNPVMMIDPTGMEGEESSSSGGETNVNNNEINIIGNISIARNSASIESYDFGDTSRRMSNRNNEKRDNSSNSALHEAGVAAIGDHSPNDIIIRNSKGEIMYRILSNINRDVTLDTNITIGNPMTINLSSYEKMGAAAVGFNIEYSGTFGGGMNGGLTFVYFMAGMDAGSAYLLSYTGGNVGLEGGVGMSKFYSTYNDKDLKNLNITGFSGKSSGYGGGVGAAGVSYSWSNRDGVAELWQGQKSVTTWKSVSIGASKGGNVGAKIFWSNSIVRKKLF